jgi:polyisoprenoid-binding protein YceI
MKKNVIALILQLVLIVAIVFPIRIYAQNLKAVSTNSGTMKLSGTSSMHDWCMNGNFKATGNYKMAEGTNKLQSLNSLDFELPVENLKSDKKKLDETAYKALKTEEYKDIHFKLTSSTVIEQQSNKYKITANGNLTIAGVTKLITMEVFWTMNPDHSITCTGIQKLKMTDFNVDPPRFLGVLKTGNDISLNFDFQLKE